MIFYIFLHFWNLITLEESFNISGMKAEMNYRHILKKWPHCVGWRHFNSTPIISTEKSGETKTDIDNSVDSKNSITLKNLMYLVKICCLNRCHRKCLIYHIQWSEKKGNLQHYDGSYIWWCRIMVSWNFLNPYRFDLWIRVQSLSFPQ